VTFKAISSRQPVRTARRYRQPATTEFAEEPILVAASLEITRPPNRISQWPLTLGDALRGLGISREQLDAVVTRAYSGDDCEVAVLSTARLWCPSGWPLAIVTEQVYTQFLDSFPPPWPLALSEDPS
jgi:hypothetical protein